MSSKTIKLYEQHVRDALLLNLRKEQAMQAANMPSTPPTIALVDFSNLLVRNYKAMANDAGPNDAGQVTLNQIAEIRQMCETVVVCMDSPPYLRKQVYAEYKGKRERDEQLEAVRAWTVERLKKDGYQIARSPGHEADDVIATLAREYPDYGCNDVRVFGNDKDACQLVSDVVRIFVPKGRGEYEIRDVEWVKQKYGVEPKDMALYQAICGDKSDGIPGIAGIGDKGAAKLIIAYKDPAGMAAACAKAVEESKKEGAKPLPAFWRNYAAGMVNLPKWLQLTTLNRQCETEHLPLDYLERLEPQPLVEEDAIDDCDPRFPDEVDDWEPSADELAEERAAMAASLPVDPFFPPLTPEQIAESKRKEDEMIAHHNQSLRTEPPREPQERRAAMAAEADKVFPLRDPKNPELYEEQRPPMVIGKDPKADEALRKLAAERNSTAPSRQPANPSAHASDANTGAQASVSSPSAATPPAAARESASPTPMLDAMEDAKWQVDAAKRAKERNADPKAAPSTSAEAGSAPAPSQATASSAHVVPPTQGPRKLQDEITSTAIARVDPPSWTMATQPCSANEMLQIAKVYMNSRFYSQYGTPQGVFAVCQLGRELGMGVAASVESFHIVDGKPFPKATTLRALAERHPDCEWLMVVSADEKQATVKTKHRKAGELTYQYTIERAEKAGYLTGKNKHNWLGKTQEMLEARATSKAVRRWYPGSVLGMHAAEEAHDD